MIIADRLNNCGPEYNAEKRMNTGLPNRIRTCDPQLRRLSQKSSIYAYSRLISSPQLLFTGVSQSQYWRGALFFCGPEFLPF